MVIQNTGRVLRNTFVSSYKPAKSENTDFSDRLVAQKAENGFESFAPHAPVRVKQAWHSATEEAGSSGLGIGSNGLMTHISAAMVIQAEQKRATGSGDIFGNSVSSAKEAAQKILTRLENPAAPETNQRIRELHDEEKTFYRAFINNLDK